MREIQTTRTQGTQLISLTYLLSRSLRTKYPDTNLHTKQAEKLDEAQASVQG